MEPARLLLYIHNITHQSGENNMMNVFFLSSFFFRPKSEPWRQFSEAPTIFDGDGDGDDDGDGDGDGIGSKPL